MLRSAREVALFITAALGASALIAPFFLHHVDKVHAYCIPFSVSSSLEKIPLNSALMACGGVTLLFVTVLVYHIYFNAEDEQGVF